MKNTLIILSLIVIALLVLIQCDKKSISTENNAIQNNESQKKDIITPISEIKKEISNADYYRFIFVKNTTEEFIINMIKEYGELSGNEDFNIYSFGIANHNNWKVIKVDESISFYVYHNLVGWLTGYDDNPNIPELSVGFSKSKTDKNEDYIFYLDPRSDQGDTEIGVFNNNKSFYIYLPEAYEEKGNLTITNEFEVSMSENIEYWKDQGFSISKLEELNFIQHQIKMSE